MSISKFLSLERGEKKRQLPGPSSCCPVDFGVAQANMGSGCSFTCTGDLTSFADFSDLDTKSHVLVYKKESRFRYIFPYTNSLEFHRQQGMSNHSQPADLIRLWGFDMFPYLDDHPKQ